MTSRSAWRLGLLAALLTTALTFSACSPSEAAGGYSTLGFGTGGSGCTLATTARSFATSDAIRSVAEYSPPLIAGTVVTIDLSRDGVTVEGYPSTLTLDVDTACVSGSVARAPVPVGHYRLEVDITTDPPSTVPPTSGEFDVA